MKYKLIILTALVIAAGCTKLEEKLGSQTTAGSGGGGGVTAANILAGTYDAMRGPYQDQSRVWAAQQHTSDETIGPTRAGDWDDNGVWRVLHTHQWDATHGFLADTYRELGQVDLTRATTPGLNVLRNRHNTYKNHTTIELYGQAHSRGIAPQKRLSKALAMEVTGII